MVLSDLVSLTFIQYSFNIYSYISGNFFNCKLYFISVINLFCEFKTNYFTHISFYLDYRTLIQFIVPFISIIIHFLILCHFISLITIFYEFNTYYFMYIILFTLLNTYSDCSTFYFNYRLLISHYKSFYFDYYPFFWFYIILFKL